MVAPCGCRVLLDTEAPNPTTVSGRPHPLLNEHLVGVRSQRRGGPLRGLLRCHSLERAVSYDGITERRSFCTPFGIFRRSLTVLLAGTVLTSVPCVLAPAAR